MKMSDVLGLYPCTRYAIYPNLGGEGPRPRLILRSIFKGDKDLDLRAVAAGIERLPFNSATKLADKLWISSAVLSLEEREQEIVRLKCSQWYTPCPAWVYFADCEKPYKLWQRILRKYGSRTEICSPVTGSFWPNGKPVQYDVEGRQIIPDAMKGYNT